LSTNSLDLACDWVHLSIDLSPILVNAFAVL
jgi:hypothetical protein